FHIRDICIGYALRSRLIAALFCSCVDFSKYPLLVINGHGRNLVTPFGEKLLKCSFGFEVFSGVEEGVAEVLQPLASLLQKSVRNSFAANDVCFIKCER